MGGMVMTIEIQMLAWAIALGVLQLLTAATLSSLQRGAKWAVHARDGVAPPLTGVAARMDRAFGNFMETFPFFAAAVLAVLVSGQSNATSALGAQLYFWARVAYVPLYAAGVPYLRTLVWTISLIGLVMVLAALF
jgi:uncharacterized MAPEG superfamily protein